MEILVGDEWIEIDVAKMTSEIDDVFHREISSKTGVIIGHDEIVRFIAGFIRDMNKLELARQHEMKVMDEQIENYSKRLKNEEDATLIKIEKGKTVKDLDSFGNMFKYYMLGYVLDNRVGD